MSVSQQEGAGDSPSAATAPSETVEQQIELFLTAIRSDDAEGMASTFYRLGGLVGSAAAAPIVAALEATGLTDAMLASMTRRAKGLQTAIAWTQLAEFAITVKRDALTLEAAGAALKIEPDSAGAALMLVVAANHRGEHDEALRVIADFVGRVPAAKDDPYFIFQTAIAELGRNRPETSLAVVDRGLPRLTAAGLEFDALVLRARALSAITGRGGDAVSAWERALSVAQHPAQVKDVRGQLMPALFQAARYDECLTQLDLDIAGASDAKERTAGMKTRVNILVKKGDIDAALTAVEDLLTGTTAPEDRVDLRLQQAGIAATTGRWKDAAAHFDAALTEVPADAPDLSERRRAIQLEKVQTLASHQIDLVMTDLDELDTTWAAPGWPVPIDLRVGGLTSAGRVADALAWLEKHLALTPALAAHPAAHQLRGALKFQLGDYETALQEYAEAIKIDPAETDLRAWIASLASATNSQQWKLALASYERLKELNPDAASDPSIRVLAGNVYLRLGNAEIALKLTENIEPILPEVVGMRDLTRAEAQIKLGQIPEALATINAALKKSESAPEIMGAFLPSLQLLRAQAFNQQGESEPARGAATVSINAAGQTATPFAAMMPLVRLGAFMQRSLASYKLGKFAEAQADIDTAIADFTSLSQTPIRKLVDSSTPEFGGLEGALWYAKGAVLDAESRSEEALAAYTRAEKLETQGAQAAIARGYALFSTGAFTEATFAFDTALTRASSPLERAKAFAGKGRALVRLKRYEKAITALQSALDARLTEADDDPVVFEQLGIAYSSLQRHDAAKRAFYRAWTLTDEKERSANLARGVTAARLRSGDPEAALRFLEDEVPSKLADERTLQFNRALALDALGRRRAAIPFLVRARDGGLDHAQLELDRLDAPAGLGRWTHYWFGAQANQTRRAFGIAFAIIALTGLAAPVLPWWLHGKLEWYLLLLPAVVALLLLALPNMKSIGFEGGGLNLSLEPLSATGRDAAAVAAPESFEVPMLGAVSITTTESKLL